MSSILERRVARRQESFPLLPYLVATPSPNSVNNSILIVGGGVAGLSAAVHLSRAGCSVTLIERRQHLGGRTYSFQDETTGDTVDNGQHLLMGCYAETLRYLDLIGSRRLARLQRSLHIDFADVATGRKAALHAAPLPAPLHMFAGLLQLPTLTRRDKLRLLTIGLELLWSSPRKEYALQHMTVEHWLRELGQSESARRYLWDVIAIGSLNDAPDRVSALPFFRVLRTAFFGKRSNASLLIPTVGLSELLIHPARDFIESHNGRTIMGTAVSQVVLREGRTAGVRTGSNELPASHVILAVPQHAVGAMLPDAAFARSAAQLTSSPIITVNLWFDRTVMEEDLIALLNGRMQWAFNRSRMLGSTKEGQYVACVLSGAGDFVMLEKDELVEMALKDLRAIFPAVGNSHVRHSLVVKEMRATFAAVPGSEQLRPNTSTSVPGLFIAGDWTNTGFPATIEGAILSGRMAAESVLADVNIGGN